MIYIQGKKYVSSYELSSIFTKDYGRKITPAEINYLCGHYKIPKKIIRGATCYNFSQIIVMRNMKEDFMEVLDNILTYGDAQGPDKYLPQHEEEIDYTPNESNMDYVNNELLDKYNNESVRRKKTIIMSESQMKKIMNNKII